MHGSLPSYNPASGSYRPHADLMGYTHKGGKTLLLSVEGLYEGVHGADDVPRQWDFEPFNGSCTYSIFAPQDSVALEMVGR